MSEGSLMSLNVFSNKWSRSILEGSRIIQGYCVISDNSVEERVNKIKVVKTIENIDEITVRVSILENSKEDESYIMFFCEVDTVNACMEVAVDNHIFIDLWDSINTYCIAIAFDLDDKIVDSEHGKVLSSYYDLSGCLLEFDKEAYSYNIRDYDIKLLNNSEEKCISYIAPIDQKIYKHFVKKIEDNKHYQFNDILKQSFRYTVKYFSGVEKVDGFLEEKLEDVDSLIKDINYEVISINESINLYLSGKYSSYKSNNCDWYHKPLSVSDTLLSGERGYDLAALTQRYIEMPWIRNKEIDTLLLDALIFCDVVSINSGNELKYKWRNKLDRMFPTSVDSILGLFAHFGFLYAIPISLLTYLYLSGYTVVSLILSGAYLLRLATLRNDIERKNFYKEKMLNEYTDIKIDKCVNIYHSLADKVYSSRYVREKLLDIEDSEINFNPAIYALLDYMGEINNHEYVKV